MYFRLYTDVSGQWRWTLFASNGNKIANCGEGYVNKADCKHGIALVKGSSTAPVME